MNAHVRSYKGGRALLLAAVLAAGFLPGVAAADEIVDFVYGTTDDAIRFGFWSDCEPCGECGFYNYKVTISRDTVRGGKMVVRQIVDESSVERVKVLDGSVTGLQAGTQYYLKLYVQWDPDGDYVLEWSQPFVTAL